MVDFPDLTVENTLAAMKEVVDEHPGYRYDDRVREILGPDAGQILCMYEINGQPACFVGMVLDRLGMLEDMLEPWEGDANGAPVDEILSADKEVVAVLSAAQFIQDKGDSWEEAYQAAKRVSKIPDAVNLLKGLWNGK